jgi:hypothetical protein
MLGGFPILHPGETVHSGIARLSSLLDCQSEKRLVASLFGRSTITAVKDFPAQLARLVSSFPKGSIPSPTVLINKHTLFPFFAAFQATAKREVVRQQMINSGAPYLALGLMAASCPYPNWLRFCPKCADEDRRELRETFWHRAHQVPGITSCAKHGIRLQDSAARYHNERNRHEFVDAESTVPQVLGYAESCCDVEAFMAFEAEWLLDHPAVDLPPERLREFFLRGLIMRNIANYNEHIRLSRLKAKMLESYGAAFLTRIGCGVSDSSSSWLTRMLGRNPRRQHPVRYLLMSHFLEQRLSSLFVTARNVSPEPFGSAPWPCLNRVCVFFGTGSIHAVDIRISNNGRSVKGTFACAQCGMKYLRLGPDHSQADRRRKDKIPAYGEVWESLLIALWNDSNISLRELSRKLGVDARTVQNQARRLSLSESRSGVSIASDKKDASLGGGCRPDEITSMRDSWLTAQGDFPFAKTTDLRLSHGKSYIYLYRHDRAWLLERVS